MHKKILLISYTALMSATSNGRTMQLLLKGILPSDISLFCSYGFPDPGSCSSAYKVSNKNALMSILKPSAGGGELDLSKPISTSSAIEADARKGSRKSWKYLLKEYVWAFGRWNGKKLEEWLKNQNIDCIIYMYSDSAASQKFATFVSQKLSIPLIVYSCENYCLKMHNYIDYKDHSSAFKLYQRKSKKATDILLKSAYALITNSDALGKEYQKKYNIKKIQTVMMTSELEFIDNSKVRNASEIKVSFFGSINESRSTALVEVACAINTLNSTIKLDVYGKISDEKTLADLSACPYINYCGFVSYDDVVKVMRESSLIIQASNQDSYVSKDNKFAFSTKYADCFACGTPFMVYAPSDIIETQFALDHNCAFVATKKVDLSLILQEALFNEEKRFEQIQKAKNITMQYFNKEKNISIVDDLIAKATNKEKIE